MNEPTPEEVHSARLTLSDCTSSLEEVHQAYSVLARKVDASLPPEPGSVPLVKGTLLRLTRLDAQGKPTGETVEFTARDSVVEFGSEPVPLKDRCPLCNDERWLDDPTACGDDDHCSPVYPCPVCNPNGED